jgi:PleD family two-component response regulator
MVSQKDHASKNKYKYILAVDDDSDIVTLIEHALKRHRFKVSAFTDGKEWSFSPSRLGCISS